MKRTKRCTRMRSLRQSLYRVGCIALCIICAQWMAVDSAFANAAVVGAAMEEKMTSPSRNEATNPLKEPTPSTLQGAFLKGNNLTDVNNGSASTPPAEMSVAASTTTIASASTTASTSTTTSASTTASTRTTASATTAAAVAETVLNVRTAAVATSPVQDNSGNNGSAPAVEPSTATTNRPLESEASVVRTSAEPWSTPNDPIVDEAAGAGDYGTDTSNDNKNIMVNMLKNWFDHKDEGYKYGGAATEYQLQNDGADVVPSKVASPPKAAGAGSKSLFERWDEASEEQERVLEDAMRTERPYDDEDDGASSSSSSVLAADQNTPSRWFVLLLSGNSTVAQMRRTDFAKYLKLNLAARLSLEYDEIKINRVLVVPPRLMVNVSVVPVSERASAAAAAVAAAAASSLRSSSSSWSSSRSSPSSDTTASQGVRVEDDDPLHNLVETNATLMELSGEEYRVERFMSLKSQKPQSMEETAAVVSNRHADIDYFIYATVGPLCFVVVLGFLLLTLCKYVRKHPVQWPWKRKFSHPSFWPVGGVGGCGGVGGGGGAHHLHRHRRMTDDCCSGGTSSAEELRAGGSVNVIYSGEFEQSQQQQLSGSWLDDASFVPDDSLDRIRTPTLLRTAAVHPPPPPSVAAPPEKSKLTFTDMLQQCDEDDHRQLLRHHRLLGATPGGGQCAAAAAAAVAAVHAQQSPRLSRENKLRILGCKQSCLLLPAVQPSFAATAAIDEMTTYPPPPSQSVPIARSSRDDGCFDSQP